MLESLGKILNHILSEVEENNSKTPENSNVSSGIENPFTALETWLSEDNLINRLKEQDHNIKGVAVTDYHRHSNRIFIKLEFMFKGELINPEFRYCGSFEAFFNEIDNELHFSEVFVEKILHDLSNNTDTHERLVEYVKIEREKQTIDENVNDLLAVYGKYISSVKLRKGEEDLTHTVLANKRLKNNLSKQQLDFIHLIESRGYTIANKGTNVNKEEVLFTFGNFVIMDNKIDSNFDFHNNDFQYISTTLKSLEEQLNRVEFDGSRRLRIKDGWDNKRLSLSQHTILAILKAKGYEVYQRSSSHHPDGSYFPGGLSINW